MKKSNRLPFYLPNLSMKADNTPIPEPEDNLYNNPDEDETATYAPKSQTGFRKVKQSKKSEKDSFDEI